MDSTMMCGQLGEARKSKIVLFSEFDFNLLPPHWVSVLRFIDTDGEEKVIFWYDIYYNGCC